MLNKIVKIRENPITLKQKIYGIIISIAIVMISAILANTSLMYIFVDNVRILMDDNLTSYKFQEAIKYEFETFEVLMRDRTPENEEEFQNACKISHQALANLPYSYEESGEDRYEIIWSILNSYEIYVSQRDKAIKLNINNRNYIQELYKTYRMQGYIQKYADKLLKEVMDGGNLHYEERVESFKKMPYTIFVSSLFALSLFFVFTNIFVKGIVKVLSDLISASKEIEKNNYSGSDVECSSEDEVGQLVHAFNKMKHSTQGYVQTLEEKRVIEEKLYQQELERANLEQKFSLAQLQLIKSQLNPHFLFNTLNMVTRTAQLEEAEATEEMLIALSNLLRYSLRTKEPFVPLNQELKVVRDYMYIQEKRFGDRVKWEIDCQVEESSLYVPVFLVQPLVENAVIHGISMKEEGGKIIISIIQLGGFLHIVVEDTGNGMTDDKLLQIREAIKQRSSGVGIGLGLGNIYQRITAYYEQGNVIVESKRNVGTKIEVILGKRK